MSTNDRSERKLSILCFSEQFLPVTGGAVSYVDNLCGNLARNGHKVYLITSTYNDFIAPNAWKEFGGYNIYNLGIDHPLLINTRKTRKIFLRQLGTNVDRIVKEIKPDIVHILYGHYLPTIINSEKFKKPLFWTVQNTPPNEYRPLTLFNNEALNGFLSRIYFYFVSKKHQYIFHKFQGIFLVASEKTHQLLIEKKIKNEQIAVIPNGVDENIFYPTARNEEVNNSGAFPVILTVAGIAEHKGQLFLIRAMKEVVRRYPSAKYINIGPIRDEKYALKITEEINGLGLFDSCAMLSCRIDALELVKQYNNCDVYVQPSMEEGFCIALLEAAFCGRPVVGTDTGAIPQIITEYGHGKICPAGDSNCLAREITDYIRSNNTGKFIPSEKFIQKYSWHSVANRTSELYLNYIQTAKNQ